MMWIDLGLALAILYCAYTDVKTRKIKNYITFPLIGVGLLYNVYINGIGGAIFSLKGMIVCGLLSLLLFFFGGFGLGDVKLFMGVGAIKGTMFTLDVLVFSFFASTILSFLLSPRRFIKAIKNVINMIKSMVYNNTHRVTEEDSAMKIPYAVYVMIGFIIAYLLGGGWVWQNIFIG